MKLVIRELKKSFDKKEVLSGASFSFEKGKIYGLLGRNGAGKTTFFNCINEDMEIDGGEFFLEDEDGAARKPAAEDIGYVLSTPVVPEFLTGRELSLIHILCDLSRGFFQRPFSAGTGDAGSPDCRGSCPGRGCGDIEPGRK